MNDRGLNRLQTRDIKTESMKSVSRAIVQYHKDQLLNIDLLHCDASGIDALLTIAVQSCKQVNINLFFMRAQLVCVVF